MPKTARFWCNLAVIGLAHMAVITGLIQWSRKANRAPAQSVVWLGGGAGDGGIGEKKNPPPARAAKSTPWVEAKTEPLKEDKSEEDRPVLTSAPSDIQLPRPQDSPTPIASASPARTPISVPTPKVKTTPRSTPKPKPKPTPKPSPKKITLVKASPKPTPRVKPSPPKSNESGVAAAEKKKIEQPPPAKTETAQGDAATAPGSGGGPAGGAGGESQFGWYGSMLHDRFYSEWVQPNNVASAVKNSVLVKIRIEKDGRVSSFDIIRPSGSAELDQSVAAVAKRVNSVDPLPAGLGNGDHYDIKISFELNSE
jgi:TonB family protein